MSPVTWTKLALEIFYRNFKDSKLPFKYFLVVNKSCGSKCVHCHIWKNKPELEMSLDEYKLLAEKSKSNLIWLNISGGEPTDRSDLKEIIEVFLKTCPKLKIINFTSNGLNIDALENVASYLNTLKDKLIGLNISIDGPPEVHDSLRGTPGGFDKAVAALKMIRKFSNIKSAAAMTLFPTNHQMIAETVQILSDRIKDFGLKNLHLNYPHSSEHYYGIAKISYKDKINMDYVSPFFIKNSSLFNPFETMESLYQKNLLKFVKTGKTPIHCASVRSNIYISEKGDVYPCTLWNRKIGSIRETNFDLEKVLSSKVAKDTKLEIKNKKCPNCWSPCEAFPSLLTDVKGSVL